MPATHSGLLVCRPLGHTARRWLSGEHMHAFGRLCDAPITGLRVPKTKAALNLTTKEGRERKQAYGWHACPCATHAHAYAEWHPVKTSQHHGHGQRHGALSRHDGRTSLFGPWRRQTRQLPITTHAWLRARGCTTVQKLQRFTHRSGQWWGRGAAAGAEGGQQAKQQYQAAHWISRGQHKHIPTICDQHCFPTACSAQTSSSQLPRLLPSMDCIERDASMQLVHWLGSSL